MHAGLLQVQEHTYYEVHIQTITIHVESSLSCTTCGGVCFCFQRGIQPLTFAVEKMVSHLCPGLNSATKFTNLTIFRDGAAKTTKLTFFREQKATLWILPLVPLWYVNNNT